MKLYILAFTVASAVGAAAAGINGLPDCAKTCATGSLPETCGHVDIKCICSDQSFINNISCCVKTTCAPEDQQKALDFAENICKLGGVTNLPNSASCASTAAGGTPTEASTNAASTNTVATSTEATSTAATGTAATGATPTNAATTGAAGTGGSGAATTTPSATKGTSGNSAAALGQPKEVALAAAAGAAAFAIFA